MNVRRLLACAAVILSLPAQAATVAITQIVDLSTLDISGSNSGIAGALASGDHNINEGDTLDFTVLFVGNQSLKVTDLSYLHAFVYNPGGIGSHNGTSTIEFSDFSGPGASSFGQTYSDACCHHLGPLFSAAEFVTGAGVIEFSGIHMSTVVTGFGTAILSNYQFLFGGSQLSQGTGGTGTGFGGGGGGGGNAVPEPATLVLLGGGLLGVAGLRRKRR